MPKNKRGQRNMLYEFRFPLTLFVLGLIIQIGGFVLPRSNLDLGIEIAGTFLFLAGIIKFILQFFGVQSRSGHLNQLIGMLEEIRDEVREKEAREKVEHESDESNR